MKEQTKIRKGKYWFNKMTDVEKLRFSNNLETSRYSGNFNEYLKDSYTDFKDFLAGAFIFIDSIEGYWYWFAIAEKYKNVE